MKLSEKIILLRRQKGLSQEQLAEEVEVSRQAVYKWETGASVPEIDKIKKIAQFFSVSYDALLDDTCKITTDCKTSEEGEGTLDLSGRTVFVSSHQMRTEMADEDHGHTSKGFNFKNPRMNEIFSAKQAAMQTAMADRGYEYLLLQPDLLVAFFINEEAKVCGFWFDGAEQFVCPYERLVGIGIRNDGCRIDYDNPPMAGAVAGARRGLVGSFLGVGADIPSTFEVELRYTDDNGSVKSYQFWLLTGRFYLANNKKSKDAEMAEATIADLSVHMLSRLRARVLELRTVGEAIRAGRVAAPAHDAGGYEAPAAESARKTKAESEALLKEVKAYRKKSVLRAASIVGGIVVALLILALVI